MISSKTLLLAAVLCLVAPWLPELIGSRSYFLSLVGFVLLIVAGHRVAFRHDKAGIFAFWFRPAKMSKASLDKTEKWLMNLGLILVIVPVLSIVLRLVVTSFN